jgi:cysteine synthase
VTVVLDDHLLRDWLVGPDSALRRAVGRHDVATTNLWYSRLCKSAAGATTTAGALLGGWTSDERRAIIATLVALPDDFAVLPMRELAWRMGVLVSNHSGLSTLGAEAVAASEALGATVMVSSRDDSPGMHRCCDVLGISYRTVRR